jgi:hypothetical protein
VANLDLINEVIKSYFEQNKNVQKVPANELMPWFIKAGVFNADQKGGLPIRNVFRDLDSNGKLHLIPYVLAERKSFNTNWFFVNTVVTSTPSKLGVSASKATNKKTASTSKSQRDEHYVLNLCDEVLGKKGLRQHRFEFLKGDSGTKLPADIYYKELNLVIEYREKQHTEEVKFFDNKQTVSGMSRGEQRKHYDELRRNILAQHVIKLIEIDYSDLTFDSRKRLARNRDADLEIIKGMLNVN